MSRILLADDSPHAQRIGEFILRGEGFEVVTVTDGQTAILRLCDVDPDVVLADISLPQKDGYELCRHVKSDPARRHARVVLTAGALEAFDEEEAKRVQADGMLRKPFESSIVLKTVKPLVEAARLTREGGIPLPAQAPEAQPEEPPPISTDPERVRAAVTLALEAALPVLIDEVTERVLAALEEEREPKALGNASGGA